MDNSNNLDALNITGNLERFSDFQENGNISSILFHTKDISEANILRRAILSEVDTYAIEYVIFYENTSCRQDDILALRLGQMVINHGQYVHDDDRKYRINVSGPADVTSDDIEGLPITNKTPLVTLLKGQNLVCDVMIRRGIARTHVKWRPVSKVIVTQEANGFRMTIKNIGMLDSREIFKQGYDKIRTAALRPASNIFLQPLVPAYIQ